MDPFVKSKAWGSWVVSLRESEDRCLLRVTPDDNEMGHWAQEGFPLLGGEEKGKGKAQEQMPGAAPDGRWLRTKREETEQT